MAVLAAGIDPFREPARTLTRPRYDAMQAYFDDWGPEGRRMMSSCASIQVNIDSGDAATLARRWDVAHRIGPALAAAFACSPAPLHRSERLAMWNAIDPSRTKPVLASGDLAEDWSDYVLAARLMLLHEDDDRCEPVAVPMSFGEWVDEGIAGRRPTLADLDYHCTTLFPPVRPRGWLEVRWLDCLPAGLAEVASAAVVALLIDERGGRRGRGGLCLGRPGRLLDHDREPRHARPRPRRRRRRRPQRRRRGARPHRGALAAGPRRSPTQGERWPAKGRSPGRRPRGPTREQEPRLLELADPPEEVWWS